MIILILDIYLGIRVREIDFFYLKNGSKSNFLNKYMYSNSAIEVKLKYFRLYAIIDYKSKS